MIEAPVDGFVIDLVRGDLLIEIQTRGFSSMKRKLTVLLDLDHRIRIVHPIPVDKWIVKVDTDGTVISRHRSPKHGTPTDVFAELVSFPALVAHAHLEVEVVMTIEEEYRRHEANRSWRRKGWTVLERRLIEVVDTVVLRHGADMVHLLPHGLRETFSTADLAAKLGRPLRSAQQMAYCLRAVGAIIPIGKDGNSVIYRLGNLEESSLDTNV